MSLLEVEDVRPINSATFRLAEYIRYDNYEKAVQEIYGKWLWFLSILLPNFTIL